MRELARSADTVFLRKHEISTRLEYLTEARPRLGEATVNGQTVGHLTGAGITL